MDSSHIKLSFYMLVLLSSHFLCAQKIVKKSILNATTSLIQIDANNCFEVILETSAEDGLTVEAIIDGEYRKDLELKVEEKGTTVLISAGFQPGFINPNDKLSAHKVVSIVLKATVPHYKKVHLFGTNSNVLVGGWYKSLDISLNDGSCVLNNVKENVKVTTQSGVIKVHSPGGEIDAISKYGIVSKEKLPINDLHFFLRSTTGNITIRKTE